MWYKVNCEIWSNEIENLKLPIFYHSDFLSVTADAFNLNIDRYLFKKNGKILAVGAFYIKNKSIVTPEKFSFTALWFSNQLDDIIYIELAEALLQLFKNNYRKICLKLDPQIKDIRPFIWANFKVENKYTYIKKEDTILHYSISKNLSKLPCDYYSFKVNDLDEHSLLINLEFLRVLGFSESVIHLYKHLLINWERIGIVKAFNVYKQSELICSNIVLLDGNKNKVYTILLNSVDRKEKYAHTYLYTSIINWSKENGITEVDFCGANLPSIAKFKSYFSTALVGYFLISYSPLNNKLSNLKRNIKSSIKKIKNKASYSKKIS